MEESLAEPPLDENKVIHLASSSKENFNLGESPEKRPHSPIQMLPMWLTRGDDGSPSKPLPFHLYYVGMDGFNLYVH